MEPTSAEEYRKEGNTKLKAKDIQGAIDSYTHAIDMKPEDHLAWSNRSAAFSVDGSYDKALADGLKCVELAPFWSKGHHRVGSALQSMGRYQEAIDHLDAAIKTCTEGDIANLKALRDACKGLSVEKRLLGAWKGTVTEQLGGYSQVMQFEEGHKMHVMVMGQSQEASYMVDAARDPALLNIHLAIDGDQGPNVPYIIRFTDETTLEMCCPYLTPEIPTKFEGPGLVTMKKLPDGEKVDVDEGKWVDSPELEEIRKLDERTKVLRYMREFSDILIKAKENNDDDDGELPPTKGATDEEIRANKQVLKMMSVNVKVNAVEARYGSPVAQAVFLLVAQCQTPKDHELESASDELRKLMLEVGLIDEASLEETRKKFREANKFMQDQTAAAAGGVQGAPPSDGRTEATRARLQKKLESRQAAEKAAATVEGAGGSANGKKASKKKSNKKKSDVSKASEGSSEEAKVGSTPTEEMRGENSSEDEKARVNEEGSGITMEDSMSYEKLLSVGLVVAAAAVGGVILYRKYFSKKE